MRSLLMFMLPVLVLAGCASRPAPVVMIPPPPRVVIVETHPAPLVSLEPVVARPPAPAPYVRDDLQPPYASPYAGTPNYGRLPGEERVVVVERVVQPGNVTYVVPPVPPPQPVIVHEAPVVYHQPSRMWRWEPSNAIYTGVAGALIGGGVGPKGHRWDYAGRGFLIGAGTGLLLDVLSR